MSILKYLEYWLARLLISNRGRDAKLFSRTPIVANVPKNVTITSPTLGPSPSHLKKEHSQFGTNDFPELSWSVAGDEAGNPMQDVQEWLLIVEDPDAPLPLVPVHGMYYAIPASKTSTGPKDFQLEPSPTSNTKQAGSKHLTGGFRVGKNLRDSIYGGPRPPVGHGEHRYFYQVIALKEKLDNTKMSPVAKRAEVLAELEGKMLGWGEWIGVYENKW